MTSSGEFGGSGISGAELDRFDRVLSKYEGAMHVDNVDGFFSALICSPVLSMPPAWFPVVFGGEMPEFETQDEAEEVIGVLMGLWNRAAEGIDSESFAPVFKRARDDSGKVHASAHQWAFGFLWGMEMHKESWQGAEDAEFDPELGDLLFPIMAIIEDGQALMEPESARKGFPWRATCAMS